MTLPLPFPLPRTSRWPRWPRLAALALLCTLAACGGGVGTGGTGAEPTSSGTYAQGPVQGFGSVIVNDVRFDDSSAAVEDGEGNPRSRDELRLGMTVEIEAGALVSGSAGATATARRIRVDSALQGLVGSVDLAGGSFTLLGQRVTLDETTVFDEAIDGGPAGLRPGLAVEVHAQFDPAAARFRATRVELLPAGRLALSGLRLRGPLAEVDRTARTLRIGLVSYGYATAAAIPADLAAGQTVRLRLALAEGLPLRWEVRSFETALRPLDDVAGLRLRGLITAYASPTAFSVDGRPVDAGAAVLGAGSLGLGVRVEVQGEVRGGVLRAQRVEVRSDAQEQARGFELHGLITAADPALRLIVLRGQAVSTARPDLQIEGGTTADLVVGRRVEVRGVLSADRRRVEATRIRLQ